MVLPPVTEAAARDDRPWFDTHPGRRYRRRPGPDGTVWVIQRRGRDVYLRTLAQTANRHPDNDEALRQLWFEAALPDLDRATCDELIKEARKAERAATRRSTGARHGSDQPRASRSRPRGSENESAGNLQFERGGHDAGRPQRDSHLRRSAVSPLR
jgi:hypothetical protein